MPDINPATKPQGSIITGPLSAARHIQADEHWLITRKNIAKPAEGITWVPQLAPSRELFNQARQEWRGNFATHWPAYVERYERELQTGEKLDALRTLWRLAAQGQTIALLCYCPRPEHCHRSLVAKFLKAHGADVIEFEPVQTGLFD